MNVTLLIVYSTPGTSGFNAVKSSGKDAEEAIDNFLAHNPTAEIAETYVG